MYFTYLRQYTDLTDTFVGMYTYIFFSPVDEYRSQHVIFFHYHMTLSKKTNRVLLLCTSEVIGTSNL